MNEKKNQSRRRILQSLVAGGGTVATSQLIPNTWKKPVVDAVGLPAHAATTFTGIFQSGAVQLGQSTLTMDPNLQLAEEKTESFLDHFIESADAQTLVLCGIPNSISAISFRIEQNPGSCDICVQDPVNGASTGISSINGSSIADTGVGCYELSNMTLENNEVSGEITAIKSNAVSFVSPLIMGEFPCVIKTVG